MRVFLTRVLPALVCLWLMLPALAQADPGSARDAAENGARAILGLLNDPAFHDPAAKPAQREKIEAEILKLFDFEEFSSRTVGPTWRNFSPDQKTRFEQAFTDLLRNTYIDTLDSYNGEQVVYTGEVSSNNGERVEVRMDFVSRDKPYPLAFRMLIKNNRWVVYDVLVENISMIKNYRDQFRDILAGGDAETLISRIRQKAEEQKSNHAPIASSQAAD